ncbi:hypothetical protein EDM53_00480 [Rickettsiales endosymbiont of Peranema trichophorum]|uniref:hypothetical protein n=1 Tax=Rickettsiales endosymbiont of Peranema trichophorum TaxID=2486577 RepID=UPI0010233681|nr:hypothetical protein [Rickettsiales endosymbiont of Peranema trichophorum]RZI47720.1 hypothetical protein EDM53_00480 [Rickettsiales endosymbiont of Peranema trichophorum]
MHAIDDHDLRTINNILSTAPITVLTLVHSDGFSPLSHTLFFYDDKEDILQLFQKYLSSQTQNSDLVELTGKDFFNMCSIVTLPMFDLMSVYDSLDYLNETFLHYLYTPASLQQLALHFDTGTYTSDSLPYGDSSTSSTSTQQELESDVHSTATLLVSPMIPEVPTCR